MIDGDVIDPTGEVIMSMWTNIVHPLVMGWWYFAVNCAEKLLQSLTAETQSENSDWLD